MFESLYDDGLNPRFVYLSPVFLDELDNDGTLSHERLSAKIAGAVDAFHTGEGRGKHCTDDELNVVRDLTVEYLNPVRTAGNLRVDVWVEHLDDSSCTYGFLCSSEDQLIPYGRGERTIVKLDPELRRPSTWSHDFVEEHSKLVRTLHAYA
jgi:acyl-CoA thioester hydrolase